MRMLRGFFIGRSFWAGEQVPELCREQGMSDAIYYKRRAKFTAFCFKGY